MRNLTEEMPGILPPDVRRFEVLKDLEEYIRKGGKLETDFVYRYFSRLQLADMVLALYFKQNGLEPQLEYSDYEEIPALA